MTYAHGLLEAPSPKTCQPWESSTWPLWFRYDQLPNPRDSHHFLQKNMAIIGEKPYKTPKFGQIQYIQSIKIISRLFNGLWNGQNFWISSSRFIPAMAIWHSPICTYIQYWIVERNIIVNQPPLNHTKTPKFPHREIQATPSTPSVTAAHLRRLVAMQHLQLLGTEVCEPRWLGAVYGRRKQRPKPFMVIFMVILMGFNGD